MRIPCDLKLDISAARGISPAGSMGDCETCGHGDGSLVDTMCPECRSKYLNFEKPNLEELNFADSELVA